MGSKALNLGIQGFESGVQGRRIGNLGNKGSWMSINYCRETKKNVKLTQKNARR